MTSLHIAVGSDPNRLQGRLRGMISELSSGVARFNELKNVLVAASNGGDWDGLGAALNMSAADAQTVYQLLAAVNDDLNSADMNAMLSRLG